MIVIICDLCDRHTDTRKRLFLFQGGYQKHGRRTPTHRLDICTSCYAQLALRLDHRGNAPRTGGYGNCYCGQPVQTRARLTSDGRGWVGYSHTGGFCSRHTQPLTAAASAGRLEVPA